MNSTSVENIEKLDKLAMQARYTVTDMICKAGSGHIGGSLSLIEIIITLYFRIMKVDANNTELPHRDRLILSKGHAGPALYFALAHNGFFPKEWLATMNKNETNLPSHIDQNKTPGVEITAGSLGQGLSCAIGVALACKLNKENNSVFCIIGDGETQEGQIWEAAMYAAQQKLDNLITIIDYNKMQIDGTTDEIISLEPLTDKWKAFGWEVFELDGHNWEDIYETIKKAQQMTEKPVMIIAHTIKGKGNSVVEGKVSSHNVKVPNSEIYNDLIEGLGNINDLQLPY